VLQDLDAEVGAISDGRSSRKREAVQTRNKPQNFKPAKALSWHLPAADFK
jgi:hypothetical protein